MNIFNPMPTVAKRQAGRLAWVFAGCLLAAGAGARGLPAPFARALRQADIPTAAVGLVVQEVGARKALLKLNADTAYSPASTMKLVTTDAALDLLGPVFTWKTQAYAAGAQSGDVLQGDLIIRGGGDPKLVTENFWLFLRQIRARGIREIHGDLLLDRSSFERTAYDPARFDGDPAKPYNAGADALLLNYQALRFRFAPNEFTGGVTVEMDPPLAGFPLVAPKLAPGDCGEWQRALAANFDAGAVFGGSYASSCGERTWYVHPPKLTPTQYFGGVFRHMWRDLGGTFDGAVRDGAIPPGARLITEWESPSLPEVIRDINKYSNNVMARQLLLTLAAHTQDGPATAEQGAQVVKRWLTAKKIAAPELVIENGSGLSRTERIAPRTMARVLMAAFKSPLMPEFLSSMPLAGLDGTMRNRLKEQAIAGHAHVKTGSLDNVRAIAGYVLAASGKRYAVVCFINHPNATAGVEAQDRLLQWVYEHG